MDNFYKIKNCTRCGLSFSNDVKRIQSWFNDDVICSLKCNVEEKKILNLLGERKFEFENFGSVPSVKNFNFEYFRI